MFLPAARIRQKSASASLGRGPAGAAYMTQSASPPSRASTSRVALTPSGSIPARVPMSWPSLAAECTHAPTSSRLGRSAAVRIA